MYNIDQNDVLIKPSNFINYEELIATEEVIKNQYINLNNLGIDLISNINDSYINKIYSNMLNFINETYLPITDYDSAMILPIRMIDIGKHVYNFICIDCYNTIIPNFLNHMNCNSLESLDNLIQIKFKGDYSLVKANLVKVVKNIVDELLNLQRIDPTVQTDKMYQELLFRYSYYIELVDFGEMEMFINNYIKPLLIKNIESILWRIA